MKKITNKTRNKILKTSAYIMAIVLVLSACSIDSKTLIPFYLTCFSGAYLTLYAYANKERFRLTK